MRGTGVTLTFTCLLLGTCGAGLDCCEGDILLLLDSSGSVLAYEFSRMLDFLSQLLRPFQLGRGQVRVGLVQVGTEPKLEFGLDDHTSQTSLQRALHNIQQLQGDTNTERALALAQSLLGMPPGEYGVAQRPRVLLWLTDALEPGEVEGPMEELRHAGIFVLAVSTRPSNYLVLRRAVSPPIEAHLHFVDVDDIDIITEDLRAAIIDLIRAERLQVREVTSNSAELQWRPVLSSGTIIYDLRYGPTGSNQIFRQTLQGDSSWVKLTTLQPQTHYHVTLTPESNLEPLKPLIVSFTTLSEVLSPAVVTVSESGTDSVRVSWGPQQPGQVQQYTVEYSAIPMGQVQTVTLNGNWDSTVLRHLQVNTQYLVTVSALHSSGQKKAISVKACPQNILPALEDLQLIPVRWDSVKVQWRGNGEGLQGYWVNWKPEKESYSSSKYLPLGSESTVLSHLSGSTRVCVSPVYNATRGHGLCCTHTAWRQ
ncbi:von Willebrand factor A domain-containing protein 1-like [Denticeps clupeoides]|uniref:von Willebrand factor A domain-containing protein 1 n=1 Tax=Denticeps clupeoides TaxID=299321 RepID=A0AAY4BEE9_9TELE|nr:von Willebrand factor A domain-containing protein 1-like [Denticeps clupeoides]